MHLGFNDDLDDTVGGQDWQGLLCRLAPIEAAENLLQPRTVGAARRGRQTGNCVEGAEIRRRSRTGGMGWFLALPSSTRARDTGSLNTALIGNIAGTMKDAISSSTLVARDCVPGGLRNETRQQLWFGWLRHVMVEARLE